MIAFMDIDGELLWLFLHLARAAHARRRPLVQVRLLVLAADEALHAGMLEIAEFCRWKIGQLSPAHLVTQFTSFAHARRSEDGSALVRQLRRRYGREHVEQLAANLGLELDAEWPGKDSAEAYAAKLLGEPLAALRRAVRSSLPQFEQDESQRHGDHGSRTSDDQED